jgi:hypothetical protein
MPERKPDIPLSAAMERMFDYMAAGVQDNELFSQFKYTRVGGFDYRGGDGTVTRRDPSRPILAGGRYYIWYTKRHTVVPPVGAGRAQEATDKIPSTAVPRSSNGWFVGLCMTFIGKPSLLAISLHSQGDVTDAHQVLWRYDRDTPYVPSPLVIDDTLYILKDETPILTGLNVHTGEVVSPAQRLRGVSGKIDASPVAIGNRLYFTAGRPPRGGESRWMRV